MNQHVRLYIMTYFINTGRAPTIAQASLDLALPPARIISLFEELAQAHIIVLQENKEILMALPFSAVPTGFEVSIGEQRYWGNCIWDALAIPAMLKKDGEINTACGCCSYALKIVIKDQQVAAGEGIIHFALPLMKWWDNIVFT
jgi:hypothetical protein